MDIVAIDFEASCLPQHGRSFPIEVGLCDGARTASWLIAPLADWSDWGWTQEAQALHGIKRSDLASLGQAPHRIVAEMERFVRGRRIVADSILDQYWLDLLYRAAGGPPVARIDHVALLLDELGADATQIEEACAAADARGFQRHRAAGDACWLADVLGALGAGRRLAAAA